MKAIKISPTNKASQRTKNRIRERGPVFTKEAESSHGASWLLRAVFPQPIWIGWLPRNQFHVECVGKKFIEKVLG
jgi:hypothetical protein